MDEMRIKVPGAELNDLVEVRLETISEINSTWSLAHGKRLDENEKDGESYLGSVISDVILYDELPPTNLEKVICPVDGRHYTGQPASVAGHVSGKRDRAHEWDNIGYEGANAYKSNLSTSTKSPESSTGLLHLSDSHLGASLEKNSNYSSENRCLKGFRRAIDVAIDREVQAVLNTGDLFHNDRRGIPGGVEDRVRAQLQRLDNQDIPFYSIDGDHEREEGREVLDSFEDEGLVTGLTDNPRLVGNGIALYGRDYAPPEEGGGLEWSPKSPPTNRYNILALHQSIKPITNSNHPDCSTEDVSNIAKPQIHAIAAGHLHLTGIAWEQKLPFILGCTTEPKRAAHGSSDPVVGQFVQNEDEFRYQRIRLPIETRIDEGAI